MSDRNLLNILKQLTMSTTSAITQHSNSHRRDSQYPLVFMTHVHSTTIVVGVKDDRVRRLLRHRSDNKGLAMLIQLAEGVYWCMASAFGSIVRVTRIGDKILSSPEPAAHGELVLVHYFFFCFLGGVTGRPVLMPP